MIVMRSKLFSLLAVMAIVIPPVALAGEYDEHAEGTTLDSTKVVAPPRSKLRPNIKYIESKSDLVDTKDTALIDSLPECPSEPTNCPDLNRTGESASSKQTCPDVCISMRTDTDAKSKLYKGYTIYTEPGSVEGEAFCPPTYTAVGVAKNMPDLSFQSPGPELINIDSLDVIAEAKKYGYTCGPDGMTRNTPIVKTQLAGGPNNNLYCPGDFLDIGNSFTNAFNSNGGNIPAEYQTYKDPKLGTIYVVQLMSYYAKPENNTCQVAAGTLGVLLMGGIAAVGGGAGGIVDVAATDAILNSDTFSQSGTSGTMCSRCSGPASNPNYDATFQFIRCNAPEGWYPTNTYSPHGTICTRVRSEWKSLQDNE